MNLRLYPLRLREDQIIRLEEKLPKGQIAPTIRKMIDDYFEMDQGFQAQKIKDEIVDHTRKIQLLQAELKAVEEKQAEREASIQREKSRIQYLKDNPNAVEMFKNNTISHRGYHLLKKDLKFSTKAQVIEWLNDHVEVLDGKED